MLSLLSLFWDGFSGEEGARKKQNLIKSLKIMKQDSQHKDIRLQKEHITHKHKEDILQVKLERDMIGDIWERPVGSGLQIRRVILRRCRLRWIRRGRCMKWTEDILGEDNGLGGGVL